MEITNDDRNQMPLPGTWISTINIFIFQEKKTSQNTHPIVFLCYSK